MESPKVKTLSSLASLLMALGWISLVGGPIIGLILLGAGEYASFAVSLVLGPLYSVLFFLAGGQARALVHIAKGMNELMLGLESISQSIEKLRNASD